MIFFDLTLFRGGAVVVNGLIRIFALVVMLTFVGQRCEALRYRGRHQASKGCEFPSRWTGIWFQKGVHPPIKIEKDVFSFKGKCVDSESPMFFIEDSKEKEKCYRCVAIYEKHPNVLQYRETYCDDYKSLDQACSILNADATLYSIFRVDAEPVPCQLRGPFTFTYSRGGRGECKYPVSTVDSCTDESRLLFRFQACADVMGSESSVEELSCFALWKEGSAHYLVGKTTNRKQVNMPFIDDNAYRCFMFEFLPEKGDIQMSQNADATCDGLVSPWEGSRIMKLVKRKHPTSSCQFPSWVTSTQKWHTLEGKTSYIFSHKNTSFKMLHEKDDTKFICIKEVEETANLTAFVTHGLSGCDSGYVCLRFHKRQKHIIEIQMSTFTRSPQEACHVTLSYNSGDELQTLIAANSDTQSCPQLAETSGVMVHVGKTTSFQTEICEEPLTTVIGCQSSDALRILITCASFTDVKSFSCHGHWRENGRGYLITSLRDTKNKYCFVYRDGEKMTHVSGVHDTCRRDVEPGLTGNFVFNVSSAGECDVLLNCCVSLSTSQHVILFVAFIFVAR